MEREEERNSHILKKVSPTHHSKKKDIPEIFLPFSNFHPPTFPHTQISESVAHYEQVRTLYPSNPLLLLSYFCFLNLYEHARTE